MRAGRLLTSMTPRPPIRRFASLEMRDHIAEHVSHKSVRLLLRQSVPLGK